MSDHDHRLTGDQADDLWLIDRIPAPTRGIGMRRFLETLRRRCPGLQLGNFTRPWAVRQPISA